MNKGYAWRKGARVPKGLDAKVAGEELEQIRDRTGGIVKPVDVVEAARSEESPLHSAFEWNDTEAGAQYRLQQARQLISSVTVVFIEDSGESLEPIRAFVNVHDEDDRGYTSITMAMSDEHLREQIVQKALDELKAWQRRYQQYDELAKIFAALDQTAA